VKFDVCSSAVHQKIMMVSRIVSCWLQGPLQCTAKYLDLSESERRTEAEQDMVYSCSCFKGGVLISVTSHYLYVFCLLQIKRDQPGSHPAACRYLPLLPATLPPAARLHSLPTPRPSFLAAACRSATLAANCQLSHAILGFYLRGTRSECRLGYTRPHYSVSRAIPG